MWLSNIKLKDPLFSISFLIQTLFLISTLLPLYVHKMRFSNRKNMKANWKFIHIRGRPKQQPDKFQTIRGKVFVCIWIALFSLTLSLYLFHWGPHAIVSVAVAHVFKHLFIAHGAEHYPNGFRFYGILIAHSSILQVHFRMFHLFTGFNCFDLVRHQANFTLVRIANESQIPIEST